MKEIIEHIVLKICSLLNIGYNADANDRAWLMMDGRIIKKRFIYVICYKLWKNIAVEREELKDCAVWEETFGYTAALNAAIESHREAEEAAVVSEEAIAAGGEGATEDASAQVRARETEAKAKLDAQNARSKLMECAKKALIARVSTR